MKLKLNKKVWLRVLIALMLFFVWHLTQQLISSQKAEISFGSNAILDQSFEFSASINHFLNENKEVSRILLIFMSIEIDLITVLIFVKGIFGRSFKPIIGLVLVMMLRQMSQFFVSFPIPDGMIWFDTGFPTLFVTYSVKNDFFFSGHTALTVYGSLVLFKSSYTQENSVRIWVVLKKIAPWFLILFQVSALIVLKAHYYMDIYAGFMTALAVYFFMDRSN